MATKPPVRLEDTPLCSGYGKYHSDGGKNPRQLETVTLAALGALLVTPERNVPKDAAQWAIFSGLLTRSHDAQRQEGTYYALWVDVDDPQMTFAEMVEVAGAVIPGDFMAYTSRSATEEKQKARFIVPLAEPIKGQDYQAYAKTLNRKMTEVGIPADNVTERTGQPCYLPNRGDFYDHHSTDFLGAMSPDEWVGEIADEKAAQEAQEQACKQQRAEALAKAAQRVANGTASPVDAFKAEFPIPLMLDSYGYQSRGNRWLSPNSSSKSPGVSIANDGLRWISQHGSDEAAGIGKAMQTGGCSGDAFDLYCFYEHGGDYNAAVKKAGAMLKTQDGRSVTQANQDTWRAAQAGEVSHTVLPEAANDDAEPAFGYTMVGDMVTHLKPIQWLVKGYLEADSLGLIYGRPKCGKSFLAIDWACCIATGTPWNGHKVQQGSVFYLAGEGHNGLRRRFASWQINSGISLQDAPLAISNKAALMVDGASALLVMHSIEHLAKAHGDPAVIIIDTLARNFGADENSTQDMNMFVKHLDDLRARWNATVLVVHHTGKDKSRGARGSVALTGAIDAGYSIDRDELGIVSLEPTEMKDAELPEPLFFDLESIKLPIVDEDGGDVFGAALKCRGNNYQPPQRGKAGRGKLQTLALETLNKLYREHEHRLEVDGRDTDDARVSIQDWRTACLDAGIKPNRWSDVKCSLADAGLVDIREPYAMPT